MPWSWLPGRAGLDFELGPGLVGESQEPCLLSPSPLNALRPPSLASIRKAPLVRAPVTLTERGRGPSHATDIAENGAARSCWS